VKPLPIGRHVLVMSETHLPDVYYFPRADVRTDLLTPTTLVTNCPFKGNANYWSSNVSDTLIANAAWSYEDVFDETRIIKDYLAFDWQAMDSWYRDDTVLELQPRASESDQQNPFVDWLVRDAWKTTNIPDLLIATACMLQSFGLPLKTMQMFVLTLNPQLYGLFFKWDCVSNQVEATEATHTGVASDAYLNAHHQWRRRCSPPTGRR
jgi:uncharacterized protein (DUF427 family)|tara:strand:- start:75 stop:698 length:624 start_codon:yes stop_codon:yes gene_type:complete